MIIEYEVIQDKSYDFAVKIVKWYKSIGKDSGASVLARQLLRCGTSIGANVEEAIGGQSRKDFFTKLTIAYKEARETKYWIKLLRDTNYISDETANDLLNDIEELLKIIGAIQRTIRNNE